MSKKDSKIVRPSADESEKQQLELNKETVTDLDSRAEEGEQVKGGIRIPNTTWTCSVGVC